MCNSFQILEKSYNKCNPPLKDWRLFYFMRITQEIKLKMVEDHLLRGKTLSHISESYENYDVSNIKYYVNLYKKHGSEVFLNREDKVYRRDTKLLSISRVIEGAESIRSVAIDLGLSDPTILADWIR